MPSTFDPLLRLELQATGENQNTWGTKTNNNLELLGEAIAGHVSVAVAGSGNYTLTTANATTDEARYAFITLSGVLTGNRNIIVPSSAKTYVFRRNTTGNFTITVKTATGTGVALPTSGLAIIACDGTETYVLSVDDFLLRSGGEITGVVSASVSTSVSTAAGLVVRNTGFGPAIHVPQGRVGIGTNDPGAALQVATGGILADAITATSVSASVLNITNVSASTINSRIIGNATVNTSVVLFAGVSVGAPTSGGASRIVIESATVSASISALTVDSGIGLFAGGLVPIQFTSNTFAGTWNSSAPIILPANPSVSLEAAPKQYVDTKAPLPQSAAGVGEVQFVNPGTATNYTLPAGGTWLIFRAQYSTSGTYAFAHGFSILAGGTSLGTPGATFAWVGWAWRIT